jgi:hypothetical protein
MILSPIDLMRELNASTVASKGSTALENCKSPELKAAFLTAYGKASSKASFKKELLAQGVRLTASGFRDDHLVTYFVKLANW